MWIYKSGLSFEQFVSSDSGYNKKYLDELSAEYEMLKNTQIPILTENDFAEYERSGKRIGYERKYFLRRTMLRDFALMAWLGNGEAAEHLEKIIDAVCAEPTWALPAHVSGSNIKTVIDLFAAETAQTLTEIVSLVGSRLSQKISERAIEEARSRVLDPFISRTEKYNWEAMRSNWCAVCGGSMGMTAVYLTEDTDELKRVTESLIPVFENYMKSFSNDGACLEGLYYWGYGMTYLISFLDLYRERTNTDFPVNTDKLVKMADFAHKCCISDGITVSFSDGNERDRIYSGLSSKLTELYGAAPVSAEYRAYLYGDDCGRWCRAVRDIAWTYENKTAPQERTSILSDAQWAVIRGAGMSFAFKGGGNGEPHNHNDIGSLVVVKNGSIILCDLGAGEYTREYFSEDRYNVFCTRSAGHSVPLINGSEQKAGEEYSAKCFIADTVSAEADISGAYGISELQKCIRKIEYSDGKIMLTDKYELKEPARITERFIIADGKFAQYLETDKKYRTETSIHKHSRHDGTVMEITAVDFIFDAEAEYTFKLIIK